MTAGTQVYGDEDVDPSHTAGPRFVVLGTLPAHVTPPNGCPCKFVVLCISLSRHGDRLACEAGTVVEFEDGTRKVL